MLWNLFRRTLAAVVLTAMLLCVAEVALRVRRQADQWGSASDLAAPSRLTMSELPPLSVQSGPGPSATEKVTIRVNSLGLRGPEVSEAKPAGSLRIIWLGDETIYEPRLAENELCTARLQELLQPSFSGPIEVINAGLPAGCPLTELIKFRRSLARLSPDLVIAHVDVTDALDDQRCRAYLRLDETGAPLAVVHPSFAANPSVICKLEADFAVVQWAHEKLMQRCLAAGTCSPKTQFEQSLSAWRSAEEGVLTPLASVARSVQEQGGRFAIALCPNAWEAAALVNVRRQASTGEQARPETDAVPLAVEGYAQSLQVPCIDATGELLKAEDPSTLYDPRTGRLSASGHACYAAAVAGFLAGRNRN